MMLFVILGIFIFTKGIAAKSSWVYQEGNGSIVIQNVRYSVQFSKLSGALQTITSKRYKQTLIKGQKENLLWNLVLNSNIPGLNEGEENINRDFAYLPDQLINPSSSEITSFQYQWDDKKEELVFRYITDGKTAIRINIQFSGANTIDFFAEVNNLFQGTGVRFDFPQGLLFSTLSLNQFIYPEGIGVAFKPDFYQENKTQLGHYPPLFSDYVSLESGNETLAIYAIQKKNEFNPADLFTGGCRPDQGVYEHRFITFITPGSEWKSPVLRWVLGESTRDSLLQYSLENGLIPEKTLDQKLGNDLFDKVAKGLTVKADIREQGNFETVSQALSNYPEGSLFHPVNYWNTGFDRNYPDFLPPDEGLGSDSGFRKMIHTAHEKKMLVMPYTNFSWWNESPSLNSIDRKSITSRNLDGTLRIEYYNNGSGHVVTPQYPEVNRICLPIIHKLESDYKIDILFEDQLGARPWMYDRNTVSKTPIGYVQGIINLAKDHSKDIPLYTERGFDFLIPEISGFCGLPNLSYPNFGDLNSKWGSGNWECYPLAQYLAHDKTAFYQHDLAVETMTDTIEKLSWNLVYGYGLTVNMKQNMSPNEKEWVRLLGEIHQLIIPKYFGKKLISYTPLDSGMVQSQYGDLLIWGNFSDRDQEINQTRLSGWKVSKGGFLVTDTKYNPLAGVFSSWKNGTYPVPHLILFEPTGKLRIKTDYAIPEARLIYDPYKFKQAKISKKIENHKILLTNNQMTVSLSPDWGGRILSLTLNSDGFSPLYAHDNDVKSEQRKNDWIELGGINDWFPGEFPGELWANLWSIKEEDSNSDTTITFWTDTPDDFRIQKKYSLAPDSNRLSVQYTIENLSESEQSFVFNTHPDLALSKEGMGLLSNTLFIPSVRGDLEIPFSRGFEKSEVLVKGNYCVAFDRYSGHYLIQKFDRNFVEKTGVFQGYYFFTMELLGKRQSLAPGDSTHFTIDYILGQGDWKKEITTEDKSL